MQDLETVAGPTSVDSLMVLRLLAVAVVIVGVWLKGVAWSMTRIAQGFDGCRDGKVPGGRSRRPSIRPG